MKTIKTQTNSALLVIMLFLFACTNKNNETALPGNSSGTITQGNWKVDYFNDSGSDETYKFSGYSFSFNSNGTLLATNGSENQTGPWSNGNDDSNVKLYITFIGITPFDKISADWHVIEQSASVIKLEDVSGGNGGTDYLHFSKL